MPLINLLQDVYHDDEHIRELMSQILESPMFRKSQLLHSLAFAAEEVEAKTQKKSRELTTEF